MSTPKTDAEKAEYWRAKFLEMRRYCRTANKGAERNAYVAQQLAGSWKKHYDVAEALRTELTSARERIAELEGEMAKRHDEYAKALNRRVDVENTLFAVASSKRELLTPDECGALANKLGVSPAT